MMGFSMSAGTDWGQERNCHIVALMNISRILHSSDGTQRCCCRPASFHKKFKSLSWIFIGPNKSETWVYLSACSQTVKFGSHPTGKEIRFDLWSVEDFVAALDSKHNWIWQFFKGCQTAVKQPHWETVRVKSLQLEPSWFSDVQSQTEEIPARGTHGAKDQCYNFKSWKIALIKRCR